MYVSDYDEEGSQMLFKNRTSTEIADTLEQMAAKIVETGMDAPALLFFESIKPVSYIGTRLGGAMLAPLIPLIGYKFDDFIVPFRDPNNVDKIMQLIEQKIEEKNEKVREKKRKIKLVKVKRKKPWYWPF